MNQRIFDEQMLVDPGGQMDYLPGDSHKSRTMIDAANAIMDAAEKRISAGGFNSFSFREIAADVGIKSSSVHYHFPTKENLVAAVVRRYTDRAVENFERALAAGQSAEEVWTRAFRGTVHSKEHMCPCTILGVGSRDLPPEAAAEVQRFFELCLEKMMTAGLSSESASRLLATITGAMVLASALDNLAVYDRATRGLARNPDPKLSTRRKPAAKVTRASSRKR